MLVHNSILLNTVYGAGYAECVLPNACLHLQYGFPLHTACEAGHAECVKVLLAAGANVNVKDSVGHCVVSVIICV
jgi:hypothetical protein